MTVSVGRQIIGTISKEPNDGIISKSIGYTITVFFHIETSFHYRGLVALFDNTIILYKRLYVNRNMSAYIKFLLTESKSAYIMIGKEW
ncbi:hypothetical protein KL86CLO1_11104 [uncultured Eubacteriales bacterium]|uniref:Uncharacterized protein n=1 Tax=uncultured Eubacteriales bacterium TaxID=172733 RepID=A0A212JHM8_9FIRM|nr:hypothetical protein KL86CLO1_11104 [uncultured Eubacteriales bacterium]